MKKALAIRVVLVLALALAGAGVAHADTICANLTTAAATGTCNSGVFQQVSPQSTGSGVIDPFVRLQTNDTVEQGFDTDARPYAANNDAQTTATFDFALPLSDVPVIAGGTVINGVTIGTVGTNYLQFLLDINQSKDTNPSLLSMDQMTVSLAHSAGLNPAISDPPTPPSLGELIYNLDGNANNEVLLNFSLNPGSGAGDMFAYIPITQAQINGCAAGPSSVCFVYLYSAFGINNANNDGFEEWAVVGQSTITPTPEPGSLLLFGSGLLGLAGILRRKLAQKVV